ncbi:N-acetylmuramoyl-L-alanine amidase [Ornithinibacillus sp. BX22]|uniref:N-acetylmuramoyl-L-alanine amidase n=1 Tax=Ornithinibacillus hominis TaxID=2763055 RepID=A0A923L2L4_9BACI|nr:N-acetylmuramoyl-L-alanine amidase [Ornithinibacillus hominis]MBC5635281.1 N-acetylmuramoyl-L-alanine amidase [Ornithinibacillus hominis]
MKKWIRLVVFSLLVVLLIFTWKENVELSKALSQAKKEEQLSNQDVVVSNEQEDSSSPVYKVVIDPGHGGDDPGAIGASASFEKDFTLSLSKKLAALLEQEAALEVYMTREEDVFISTETRERPNFANDLSADLYVSIHANTFDNPSVSGTETYYYHDDAEVLANTIHKHLLSATGYTDRGVRKENYFVLTDTTMPAVLLEVGYLTNPEQEREMISEEFQQTAAEAIRDGIKEYLDL